MKNSKLAKHVSDHPLSTISIVAGIYTIGNHYTSGIVPQVFLGVVLLSGAYITGRLSTRDTQGEYLE